MTITSKVTEERTIEIDLPYFCKYGQQYLKVLNNERCIKVNTYTFETGACIMAVDVLGATIGMSIPCTEEEFNAAFDQAFEVIQNQKEELV